MNGSWHGVVLFLAWKHSKAIPGWAENSLGKMMLQAKGGIPLQFVTCWFAWGNHQSLLMSGKWHLHGVLIWGSPLWKGFQLSQCLFVFVILFTVPASEPGKVIQIRHDIRRPVSLKLSLPPSCLVQKVGEQFLCKRSTSLKGAKPSLQPQLNMLPLSLSAPSSKSETCPVEEILPGEWKDKDYINSININSVPSLCTKKMNLLIGNWTI